MSFDFAYDENLMSNWFFQALQKQFRKVLSNAIAQNCVICVPKRDSVSKYMLTSDDFLSHILIPTNELPECSFLNLCGVLIKIDKKTLTIHHKIKCQTEVQILFNETFYTEDGLKYEVLCVERPLNERVAFTNNYSNNTILKTLVDCLNFLEKECGGLKTLELLDKEIKDFLEKIHLTALGDFKIIQNSFNSLNLKCMQIALKNSKINKKINWQEEDYENLKIAVESYWQHSAYKEIMSAITLCTEADDSKLNKLIRNHSNDHCQDLKVKCKLCLNMPKARFKISKINSYYTTFEKLGCLKETIFTLCGYQGDKILLNADELLEALSFLILKTSLPNWNAQLKFLMLFYKKYSIFDENTYIITLLEAALSYIQDGIFCKFKSNICGSNENKNSTENSRLLLLQELNKYDSLKEKAVNQFFNYVSLGDLNKVKSIIENDASHVAKELDSLSLCHPLCLCDNCSSIFQKSYNMPAINSCNEQGLTALHVASMNNVPKIIEYLLARGANTNVWDCDGKTPAHYAALKGDQNALLLLLHKNADINAIDNSSNTPLHLCSDNGHENCVKALIYFSEYSDVKLRVNQQNSKGETPLHYAAKWGYHNIVEILLESGSDPTIQNKNKLTPMDEAHNEKILHLMRDRWRAKQHCIEIEFEKPLFDLKERKKEEALNNRIHKDVQFDRKKKAKIEKLLKAVEIGDINLVSFYMGFDISANYDFMESSQKESDDNLKIESKCHPLCVCEKCFCSEPCRKSEINNLEKNNFLKKLRLSVNICNAKGYTPLHVASKMGNIDLVRGFIQNGASLNLQTFDTLQTPLMMACEHQRVETARELLKSGCKVDLQDYRLNTAFHYACKTGNAKLVTTLLKYEPDFGLKNVENRTAMQEAKDQMLFNIMKTLKENQTLR